MANETIPAVAPVAGVPAASAPVVERSYEELAREIIELEKQFPPPDEGDIVAEARWLAENWPALVRAYPGTHVAVLNRAVVGTGENPLQLKLDVARKFNVHPQRFLVESVPPPEFFYA
jgi:hypothetical protein